MATYVHNSKNDIINFGGITFSGGQGENYLSISPMSDLAASQIDASGSTGCVSVMNDMRADVTVRLLRLSPVNAALAELVNRQRLNGSLYIDDITIANSSTLHIYRLHDCFIKRLPDENTGVDISGEFMEWQFEALRAEPRQIATQDAFDSEFVLSITASIDVTAVISL